jgi:3-hydroxyisobutyrate dehydrogenase-like beta-hydroxyacid dehydrogenase
MRVGVIGLGIMGAPMARNLLRAEHEIVVHGRTPARVEPLVALGAAAAVSVPLPTTAVVHQLFAAVEARGGGALGTQAIAQALEALAGTAASS